mgnify:CR=1 FL=1
MVEGMEAAHTATLLLSQRYEPIKIISWQRAITLLSLGKVEVVEEYAHDVRSVTVIIKIPAVVRLLRAFRRHHKPVKFSRVNIYARDGYTCQYCGVRLSVSELTYDHVVPRHCGGRTTWENVVCCCIPCNLRKGSRAPAEVGLRLLRQPGRPSWSPFTRPTTGKVAHREWIPFLGLVDASYWNAELVDE